MVTTDLIFSLRTLVTQLDQLLPVMHAVIEENESLKRERAQLLDEVEDWKVKYRQSWKTPTAPVDTPP